MQDEVNTKVVALAIRTGTTTTKVTASVLKEAMSNPNYQNLSKSSHL